MKKLPVLFVIAIFIGIVSCKENDDYWTQYEQWRDTNDAWFIEQLGAKDDQGNPVYTKVVPNWDKSIYVLMKYYNDYEFTSGSRIVSHKDNGGVEPVGPDIPEDALVFDLGSNYQTWSEATDATYGGGFETTVDGITLGYYKYGNNNDARAADPDHIRVYKGSAFRVKSDKNITNIILFCTGSGYCENLSPLVGGGSYSVDSSTLTIEWTGSASEIVAESAEAQVRFNKIAIVCE